MRSNCVLMCSTCIQWRKVHLKRCEAIWTRRTWTWGSTAIPLIRIDTCQIYVRLSFKWLLLISSIFTVSFCKLNQSNSYCDFGLTRWKALMQILTQFKPHFCTHTNCLYLATVFVYILRAKHEWSGNGMSKTWFPCWQTGYNWNGNVPRFI